jgi:peroxiredoxin
MRNDEAHRDDITIETEATAQYVRPGLAVGHTIPEFRLESADGGVISPSDYKERKNLTIIFFNPCESSNLEMIAEIGRRYQEFADNNAEVLAIAAGPIKVFSECAKALRSPFALLADVREEAKCAYCVAGPMLFVADRYGELRMQSAIGDDLDSVIDKALSELELIEIECPECGVSTWPVE